MKYKIEVTRQHNYCDQNYSWITEADNLDDAWVEAICEALLEGWCVGNAKETEIDVKKLVADALVKLPLGGHIKLDIPMAEKDKRQEGDNQWEGVLWWSNGHIGVNDCTDGEPDHTDKYETRWVLVKEWVADPNRTAELMKLSKEELVERLIEMEEVK